jgi:hypothetical protein
MEKQITVSGSPTWSLSDNSHANLTYTVTEVPEPASRTVIGNDQPILVNQIQLKCNCNGDYVSGTSTFVGTGSASITAKPDRIVECEGKSVLLVGDEVTITCQGTITTTSTGATSAGNATVKATIKTPNQENVCLYE